MKLDKDLVRSILLAIEENGPPRGWANVDVPGHSHEEIAHHIQLLDEAGFIVADDLSTLGPNGYDWRAKRLTHVGHEYLDTIRDSRVWSKTKEIASTAGTASISALFEIAKGVVKQRLIEHGIHLP